MWVRGREGSRTGEMKLYIFPLNLFFFNLREKKTKKNPSSVDCFVRVCVFPFFFSLFFGKASTGSKQVARQLKSITSPVADDGDDADGC